MIVTEEEAKTKRCQESFAIASVTYSHDVATVLASPSCLGSACMAWRWQDHAINPDTARRINGVLGYCGKAGKP